MLVPGFFIIGLLLIILQLTLLMFHPLWLFAPDLYYILVAFMAYRIDPVRSLLVLLPLSWVLDVFSGTILGMYPAIFFGGYFLLRLMNTKLPVRASLYQVPLTGISFLAVTRLAHVVFDFLEPGLMLTWSWPKSLIRALLIVFFTFPLFRFFEWFSQFLQQGPSKLKLFRIYGGNRRRDRI